MQERRRGHNIFAQYSYFKLLLNPPGPLLISGNSLTIFKFLLIFIPIWSFSVINYLPKAPLILQLQLLLAKHKIHVPTLNSFSPLCVLKWYFRCPDEVNCRLQPWKGHTNGFSPVCVRVWYLRWADVEKRLPQPPAKLHWYGFDEDLKMKKHGGWYNIKLQLKVSIKKRSAAKILFIIFRFASCFYSILLLNSM